MIDEKVCVVTGASSGIGRRTCVDLASEGARVCAVARREGRLVELLEEMGGRDQGHSYYVADVSHRPRVALLAEHVDATYGRCDVLINNAGFGGGRPFAGPEAIDELTTVVATNFFGAVYCTGELLPLLLASAPSSIVNVGSVAGRLALGGGSAYSASKFALGGWSEALRADLEGRAVYVSLIEPGPIPTEGFPQTGLVSHPVLRRLLGSDADVSSAIRFAIRHRRHERFVPRWYYLLWLGRVVAPSLYHATGRVLPKPLAHRRGGPVA